MYTGVRDSVGEAIAVLVSLETDLSNDSGRKVDTTIPCTDMRTDMERMKAQVDLVRLYHHLSKGRPLRWAEERFGESD